MSDNKTSDEIWVWYTDKDKTNLGLTSFLNIADSIPETTKYIRADKVAEDWAYLVGESVTKEKIKALIKKWGTSYQGMVDLQELLFDESR